MGNLKELRESQAKVVAEARERLDLINANTDESRAAELEASHDKAMAEYDRLEGLIARSEKTEAAEKRAEELRAANRPIPGDGEARAQDAQTKPEYREAFVALARAGFDPQEISPELRAVLRAGATDFRAQSTTAGAGGYTVPTDLAAVVDKTLKAWGPMYNEDICTVINTASGNPLDFPKVDDTARVVAQHSEAAAMTDDGGEDAVFTKLTLGAFAYDTEWVQISMELLQDSAINIEQFLGELLGERLARRVNSELTVGDGTGDPLGIVAASTLGVTAASTTAVTFDELLDLYHSVDPAYRASPKTRWMFNDTTLKAIRKLKGGDGQYIWQMGDVRTGAPGTLFDKPYSVNQACVNGASATKPIVFGDFGKYLVRKVGAPVIGVRREYYWPNIGLAGVVRLDGDLLQTGAVKHLLQAT
jgi:HK97 family phage major capsid protein